MRPDTVLLSASLFGVCTWLAISTGHGAFWLGCLAFCQAILFFGYPDS